MNGLALIRATDFRTSSARSENASASHPGLDPGLLVQLAMELLVAEREHPAVGVMDEDDLPRPEQPLRDRQRADLVVGDDTAGVPDHVRISLLQPEQAEDVQSRVHARKDGDAFCRRQRQVAAIEALRVGFGVLERSSVAVI